MSPKNIKIDTGALSDRELSTPAQQTNKFVRLQIGDRFLRKTKWTSCEVDSPPKEIEKIQNRQSKMTFINWEKISSMQTSWCQVYAYIYKHACGKSLFAELAEFATSLLVLPYSNAEVARTFSQLKGMLNRNLELRKQGWSDRQDATAIYL